MTLRVRLLLISLALLVPALRVAAQAPPPSMPPLEGKTLPMPKAQMPPPPAANVVAANVNGQDIPEMAVYRAFIHDPSSFTKENRKEIISHLVDNTLIDQYLSQLKIAVEPKELDDRFKQIEGEIAAEAAKNRVTVKDMLGKVFLTEDDVRKELLNSLRWEKFLASQATEKVLREMFEKNPTMFDGTMVTARHVLIPNKGPESLVKIQAIRKRIEDHVAGEMTKMPANADPITREKERTSLLVRTFAAIAEQESTCPSKVKGGDLGAFPRVGAMVEPFAKAAFALKPYQMSEPVSTEFGYHVILCVDVRPGKTVKYEDVRQVVQVVYGDRLREAVIAAYKPRSKITINEK